MADRKKTAFYGNTRMERALTVERAPRVRSVALPTIAVLVMCLVAAMAWQSRNAPTDAPVDLSNGVQKETLD